MRRRGRILLWVVPAVGYALFFFWYTSFTGPMTQAEIDTVVARLEAGGADPSRVERLREFMAGDDGRQFIMVNMIDSADQPPSLPATGPGADADALMAHYMEHMYPELFRRACHPVFAGLTIYSAMDLQGISGAETWTRVALMRYRSRRDMIAIATAPAFGDRHDYKLASLDKTIAVPVAPGLYLSDPRLLLALVSLLLVLLIDRFAASRR
jgi:hypothetical protein